LLQETQYKAGAKLDALTTASGLPKRKVQVIVAQLEAAGVVARKRYAIQKIRDFSSPEELQEFLAAYEQRGLSDRERLQEIMHYAQSTMCRVRLLKSYFGDSTEENCGHCDNCKSGAAERVSSAQNSADVHATKANPPVQVHPALQQPELVSSLYQIGETVKHRKFGNGKVVEISGENVSIDFGTTTKRVKAPFLRKAG
jgi:ATP-dependent DNA helicase RecQ